ncbi:hypothetical protein AB0L59_30090 [Streptomyces sp. NPDC052109]|uniref:DUF6907 domain-containing protein n=1 Tax=Streptomyces sp. NPDC052109 TaxID=3155527 RepID=UPI003431F2AD
MSTEPRTVTVHTLDHGNVTVPEPAWCTGRHEQDVDRADLTHYGPELRLHFRGEHLWTAMLAQAPYSPSPLPSVYVEQTGYTATLDPAGLRELADAEQAHAGYLRRLARDLEALQDGSDQ